LCLDKTGTITDGEMILEKVIPLTVKVVEINKNNPDGIIATKEPNVTSNTLIIESIVK